MEKYMTPITLDHENIRELTVAEICEIEGGAFGFFSPQFNLGVDIAIIPQLNFSVVSFGPQSNIAGAIQGIFQGAV
jgi:hypothetical protein